MLSNSDYLRRPDRSHIRSSRRYDCDERASKRRKDSFYESFISHRTILVVENKEEPTCKVSRCRWSGFDDELLSHCIHKHNVFESNEQNIVEFQNWQPSDIYKGVLLKFRSLLLWLFMENDGSNINVVVQNAAVDVTSCGFRYNVSLGTKDVQECAEFCKIAPNSATCTAKYKYTIHYRTPLKLGHLPLTLKLSLTSDRGTKPEYGVRYFIGSEDLKQEAVEVFREKFTCPVCLNYIKQEPRFCMLGHVVCNTCFPKLRECPMCRGAYDGDCRNEEAECLLRFLHFEGPNEGEMQ